VAEAIDEAKQEYPAGQIGLPGLDIVETDGLGIVACAVEQAKGGEADLCAAVTE